MGNKLQQVHILSGGRNKGKSLHRLMVMEEGIQSALDNWILYGMHPGNFTWYLITKQYEEAADIIHELLEPHFVKHMKGVNEAMRLLPKDARCKGWPGTQNLPKEDLYELANLAKLTCPALHQILLKPLDRIRDEL